MDIIEVTGNPRRDQLISLVMSKGYVSNEELSKLLNVSSQTVRRDIKYLCDKGLISRHHGGAGRLSTSIINTDFSQREMSYIEEKTAIANNIAEFIPDGSTLFITIGTTVEFIARALVNKKIRVITNSLRVAYILYPHQNIEVIPVGGIAKSHNGGITGPSAITFIRNFKADYLVSSVGAIDEDGCLLDFDINEVAIVQEMIKHSRNFILACDHTKYHASAAVEIGTIDQIFAFFSDKKPPTPILSQLKEHKIIYKISKSE